MGQIAQVAASVCLVEDVEPRQRSLLEAVSAMRSASLGQILSRVKGGLQGILNANAVAIYGVDSDKNQLHLLAAVGGAGLRGTRLPLSPSSVAGYAAHTGRVVNVEDVHNPTALAKSGAAIVFDKNREVDFGFRTKQVLAVPFFFRDEIVGVIQASNRTDDNPFGAQDVQIAQKMGELLGELVFEKWDILSDIRGKFYHLVVDGIVSLGVLQSAVLEARAHDVSVESLLMGRHGVTKEQLGNALSRFFHCPFVSFGDTLADFGAEVPLEGFNPEYLAREFWFPLGKKEGVFHVVIDNTKDIVKRNSIEHVLGTREIAFVVSTRDDITKFINDAFNLQSEGSRSPSLGDILAAGGDAESDEDAAAAAKMEAEGVVVSAVNKIIEDACKFGASDIHIEPNSEEKNIGVRFRIDGDCRLYQALPYSYRRSIVSRIKVMSNLDTTNRRFPQDGKIKFSVPGEHNVELRVATLPTQSGAEDVVMRILRKGEAIPPVSALQLSPRDEGEFLRMLEKPHGLILVVGPTGSGKTTTLHAALRHINKPDRKIWTAEDPVEITQNGLRQVQINPIIGFDFATAMRAFLRADPDVIMVGEMRDPETAKIGIEASLTGHLVFSTLHTNSAAETVVRLLDMGIDKINFADSLVGVLSQRLIKKICRECSEPYSPTPEEREKILASSVGRDMLKNENVLFFRPRGCSRCGNSGYWGRVGVFELLVATGKVRAAIREGADVDRLREIARDGGMTTLFDDGLRKALRGLVTLADVYRVCL